MGVRQTFTAWASGTVLAVAGMLGTAHAAATPKRTQPVDEPPCRSGDLRWSADDGVDYRSDKVQLRHVAIYECGSVLRIEAQRADASTLDFDNSTWTLTGEVKVRLTQGQLGADNATVLFHDGKLSTATVHGNPASFAQLLAPQPGAATSQAIASPASTPNAHGHARTIVYNLTPGEVQFIGDAVLSNGCNDINGASFTYNLAQKSVQTPRQQAVTGNARVQGTIKPQCKPKP